MPEFSESKEARPAEAVKAIWTQPHATHIDMSRTLSPKRGSNVDGVDGDLL